MCIHDECQITPKTPEVESEIRDICRHDQIDTDDVLYVLGDEEFHFSTAIPYRCIAEFFITRYLWKKNPFT